MNSKQIKDLKAILKSLELNEMVLSNIKTIIDDEYFVLEGKKEFYEKDNQWVEMVKHTGARISDLEKDVDMMETLSSSIQDSISLFRDYLGMIEGKLFQEKLSRTKSNDECVPDSSGNYDPLFEEVARLIVTSNTVSSSSLQRRYAIGYNRAGKILDELESVGIVGPANGGKPRAVLVDATELEEILGKLNS